MANPSRDTSSPGIGAPEHEDSVLRELDALQAELQQYADAEDWASLQLTNAKMDEIRLKVENTTRSLNRQIGQAVAETPELLQSKKLQEYANKQMRIQAFLDAIKDKRGPKPTNGAGSAPSQ